MSAGHIDLEIDDAVKEATIILLGLEEDSGQDLLDRRRRLRQKSLTGSDLLLVKRTIQGYHEGVSEIAGAEGATPRALAEIVGRALAFGPDPGKPYGSSEVDEVLAIRAKEEARRARLAKLPASMTCAELLDRDFPPPVWVVPELLTQGLTILAGAPKLGKSWFAILLAWAVGHGGAVLGCYRVERRSALYLALEDTPRRLKARLEKIGASRDSSLTLFTEWRSGAEGIADLDAYLEEHPEIRLAIVDTFAKLRGVPVGDDRYSADYAAAGALKALADRHECAFLAIHHVRKLASDDPMDLVSGTNGLNGAADSTWILSRARGESDATLFCTGRDIEEQTLALRFDRDLASWRVLGDADEFTSSRERRAILDELRDGKPHKSGEIAKAVGKKPAAVSNRLRDLENEGKVYSPSYGQWALKDRVSSERVKVNTSIESSKDSDDSRMHDLHGHIEPDRKPAKPKERVAAGWDALGCDGEADGGGEGDGTY